MKIREGAYYTTRGGETVGPATPNHGSIYPWNIPVNGRFLAYHDDGTICIDNRDWDIVAEEPALWRDMTPEQKGALLLAHHEGKVIEFFNADDEWEVTHFPAWANNVAYRVSPEPRRGTVTLEFDENGDVALDTTNCERVANIRITFDLLDGEPDCASIKMEKL